MSKKAVLVILFFWALALIQAERIFAVPSKWLMGPALRIWCLQIANADACYAWARREDLQRDLVNGTREAPPRALEGYRRACDGGNIPACSDLSAWYIRNNQFKESAEVAQKACDAQDAIGCYNLACSFCLLGNKEKALEFILKTDAMDADVLNDATAWQDPDLLCLKEVPEFQKLLSSKPKVQK